MECCGHKKLPLRQPPREAAFVPSGGCLSKDFYGSFNWDPSLSLVFISSIPSGQRKIWKRHSLEVQLKRKRRSRTRVCLIGEETTDRLTSVIDLFHIPRHISVHTATIWPLCSMSTISVVVIIKGHLHCARPPIASDHNRDMEPSPVLWLWEERSVVFWHLLISSGNPIWEDGEQEKDICLLYQNSFPEGPWSSHNGPCVPLQDLSAGNKFLLMIYRDKLFFIPSFVLYFLFPIFRSSFLVPFGSGSLWTLLHLGHLFFSLDH